MLFNFDFNFVQPQNKGRPTNCILDNGLDWAVLQIRLVYNYYLVLKMNFAKLLNDYNNNNY